MADEHPPKHLFSPNHPIALAEQAIATIERPVGGASPQFRRFPLADFGTATPNAELAALDPVGDVELDLTIEFGRTLMGLDDSRTLRAGSIVRLDPFEGDPVDVIVNGRPIAKGEVLVLNGNFCVRVAELIAGESGR